MSTTSEKYLSDLHNLISKHFDKGDIRTLCFQLGFDSDNLRGEKKVEWVWSLIMEMARRKRLPYLVDLMNQERPKVAWTAVPVDFQLPETLESGSWPVSSMQIGNMFKNINAETMQVVNIGDMGLKQAWKRPAEMGPRGAMNAIVRQEELDTIHRMLAPEQPQSASLVIWGLHGAGKSTLAATYASQYGRFYDGGILWVKMGAQFHPEQDVQPVLVRWAGWGYDGLSLLDALGGRRLEFKPAFVRSLLSGHGKMLVVFDDVHSFDHLRPLLEAIPGAADLLLTTQEAGHLRNQEFSFQEFEVTKLSETDALALLKQFTPSLPDFLLARLADVFDYHTQALAIIGADLQSRAAQLEAAQTLLARQDALSLVPPIQAAFKQSYDALPDEIHRRHLRQLGILMSVDSDFSKEMAAAIFGEPVPAALDSLETLRRRTLVTYLENGRWAMTTLLRQYAHSLLTDSDEIEQAGNGYYEYVFTRSLLPDIWQPGQPDIAHFHAAGEQLVVETEAAFAYDPQEPTVTPQAEFSAEQRVVWEQTAIYLQNAFDYLLMHPERHRAAQRWIAAHIAINQALADDEATALGWLILGRWYMLDQQAEQAIDRFQRAEEMSRVVDNIEIRGHALVGIGNAYSKLGQTEKAVTVLQTAEEITVGYPDPHLRAILLTSLSSLYLTINDHEHAQGFLQEAITLVEKELNDPHLVAIIKQQLGVLFLYQSQPQRALSLFQETQDLLIQLEDVRTAAGIPVNVGWTYFYLGEHDTANEQFMLALHNAEDLSYSPLKASALLGLATCNYAQQNFELAKKKLQEALDILSQHEDKNKEAQVRGLLGDVYYSLGQPDKALVHLKKALPLLRDVQDTTTSVNILNTIGLIYQQTERINEGLEYLHQTLPFIEELNNEDAQGTIFTWLAMLLGGIGDMGEAMRYFDQAQPIIENVKNDTTRATTLTLSARFYRYMGEIEKAHVIICRVVNLWRRLNNRTKLSETLLILAEIAFVKQRIDEVQDILDEVRNTAETLENTLLQANFYNLQGTIYLYTQRTGDAQRMLERAYHINERLKNPFLQLVILNNLAWVRLGSQDIDKAQAHFEAALALAKENKSTPHVALVLSNMGMLAYWRGQKTTSQRYLYEAVQVLEQEGFAADAANQSVDILRTMAEILGQKTEESMEAESLKMLLQAVNWDGVRLTIQARSDSLLTPECDAVLRQTIAAARRDNQLVLERTLSSYQRLLAACRSSQHLGKVLNEKQQTFKTVDIEQWWGYLQRVSGNYGAALAHTNRVLEIDQNNIEARLVRGWVYRGLGRRDAAMADFDHVLAQDSREHRAWQGKGVVCFETGSVDRAMTQLVKAIRMKPDDAYSFQWRGAVYQSLGDQEAARQDLDKAVVLSPLQSDHRYWRALLMLDMDEEQKALRELTKIINWDEDLVNRQVFNYFWRGVAHDLAGEKDMARFDWEKSSGLNTNHTTAWSIPLHGLVVQKDIAAAETAYEMLLKRPYAPHMLFVHIQHLALLSRLYPKIVHFETCYHQLNTRLEEIQS